MKCKYNILLYFSIAIISLGLIYLLIVNYSTEGFAVNTNPPIDYSVTTNPIGSGVNTNPPIGSAVTTNPPIGYAVNTNPPIGSAVNTNLPIGSAVSTNPHINLPTNPLSTSGSSSGSSSVSSSGSARAILSEYNCAIQRNGNMTCVRIS